MAGRGQPVDLAALAARFARGSHSIFSPSASPMWMGCSGSLIPNLLAPDTAGCDAAQGTVFHSIMEEYLRSGVLPAHREGDVVKVRAGGDVHDIEIDDEMLGHARVCYEWVQGIPGDRYIEQRVCFSEFTPLDGQCGTADLFFLSPGRLVIRDWKYGRGVRVSVERNSQALLYALGVYCEWDWLYDIQEIDIGICQPRLEAFETWTTTRAELLAFAEEVRERSHAAWSLNAPRTPSPKACQWCKVRKDCPAIAAQVEALAEDAFDDVSGALVTAAGVAERPIGPVPAATLSTADLGRILLWRDTVEKWLADVAEEMLKRLNDGETAAGWKVGYGYSRRQWTDEAETEKALRQAGLDDERVYHKKLVSPAQAEKALRAVGVTGQRLKGILAVLTYKPQGKLSLMREGYKRPAAIGVEDALDDVS